MPFPIRPRLRLLVAVLSILVLTAGSAAAQDSKPTTISFTVTLSSQQVILEQVGRGGDQFYGWNELTGSASTPSGNVDVQLLGNVQYAKGSGPFFGFLTLKFASLSTLGLRIVDGHATVGTDGSTALQSKLKVIGGNAAMTGAKGSGRIAGERGQLGQAIKVKVTVRLRGVEK